jgi:hypothetical protein
MRVNTLRFLITVVFIPLLGCAQADQSDEKPLTPAQHEELMKQLERESQDSRWMHRMEDPRWMKDWGDPTKRRPGETPP